MTRPVNRKCQCSADRPHKDESSASSAHPIWNVVRDLYAALSLDHVGYGWDFRS